MQLEQVKILGLGLTLRLRARIQGRLGTHNVRSVRTLSELRHHLTHESYSVLVINEFLIEGATLPFFAEYQPLHLGPIILLADRRRSAQELRTLVGQHHVETILYRPVDPDELVRALAKVLDLVVASSEGRPELPATSQKHASLILDRLGLIREFAESRNYDAEARQKTERVARQLIGGIASVGARKADLLAREVYNLIALSEGEARWPLRRLKQVVEVLSTVVMRTSQSPIATARRSLVVVTDDSAFLNAIEVEASLFKWSVRGCQEMSELPVVLSDPQVRAILVDYQARCVDCRPDILEDVIQDPFPCVVATDGPLPTLESHASWISKGDSYEIFVEVLRSQTAPALDDPPCVLVVDSDPIVLDLVSQALSSVDMAVETLRDGLDLWDTLERSRPDLVLLAVDLPRLNGIELCRAIRCDARYRAMPVIFLSAYSDSGTARRAFEAGADDYLLKPVSMSELRLRVTHRLERIEASRTSESYKPSRRIHSSLSQIMLRAQRECLSLVCITIRVQPDCSDIEKIRQRLRIHLRSEDVIRKVKDADILVAMLGINRKRALRRVWDALGEWRERVTMGVARFPQDGNDLETVLLKCEPPRLT